MLDPIGFALEKRLIGEVVFDKESAHQRYPDEVEYYACAFELINSKGDTVNFFSFPLMPNQLNIGDVNNVSIQKTMGGVVVNGNPTFMPFPISLNGNFGRRFRKILPQTKLDDVFVANDNYSGNTGQDAEKTVAQKVVHEFSSSYKTGYGNSKILKAIIDKSRLLDASTNNPYILVFYNLAFNQIVIVEAMECTFMMSKEMNAIWQYSINLRATAPADALYDKARLSSSIQKLMNFNRLNNAFAKATDSINSILNPGGITTSVVKTLLEKQKLKTAVNNNGTQKSGISVLQKLMPQLSSVDNFVINDNLGILNSL